MWIKALAVLAILGTVTSAELDNADCEPRPLYGVTYAPFALDSSTMCLPVEQVEEDMAIIAEMANSVRIYNIQTCYDATIVIMEAAKKYNMTVLMGLWMEGTDPLVFSDELATLPEMLEKYHEIIEYVIVGNEPLFIEEIPLEEVIENYRLVKQMIAELGYDIQTSVAEVWPIWESDEGPALAAELDFICMNMQPYWEGFYAICPEGMNDCVSAGEYIHLKAQGLQDWLEKPVVLCEGGWPTDGEPCCSGSRDNALSGYHAIPSVENAKAFLQDYAGFAQEREVKYYFHASFNEDWKKVWDPCDECKGRQTSKHSETECNSCTVDYEWGLCHFNRTRKAGFDMPEPKAQCHYQ